MRPVGTPVVVPRWGTAPHQKKLAVLLTHCGQLILGKISKLHATRRQILRLKCTKFDSAVALPTSRKKVTERRVPELTHPGSCHKPDGRLPLLSPRPAVTLATLKRAATNFAAW